MPEYITARKNAKEAQVIQHHAHPIVVCIGARVSVWVTLRVRVRVWVGIGVRDRRVAAAWSEADEALWRPTQGKAGRAQVAKIEKDARRAMEVSAYSLGWRM